MISGLHRGHLAVFGGFLIHLTLGTIYSFGKLRKTALAYDLSYYDHLGLEQMYGNRHIPMKKTFNRNAKPVGGSG
jgi:hypothetical protein